MALRGEAIECVEEGLHFLEVVLGRISGVPFPPPLFLKDTPIIKVGREKKMYFIINRVKRVIDSFFRDQTLITFI